MKLYRLVWWAVAAMALLIGAGAAIVVLPAATIVLIFLLAVTAAAVASACATVGSDQPIPWEAIVAGVTLRSTLFGAAAVAVLGGSSLIGSIGSVAALIVISVSCPRTLGYFRRHRTSNHCGEFGADRVTRSTTDSATQPTIDPEDWSSLPACESATTDDELCLMWRRSFRHLQAASTVGDQLRVIEARQRCLDELIRRYPDGIACWLASGARAASDPARFLGAHGGPHEQLGPPATSQENQDG